MLRDIWARDVLPAIQLGVQPDVHAYIAQLAKYLDLPELLTIVPTAQESVSPQERMSGGGGGVPQAGKPNGQYVRENISRGMSDRGMDQQREMQLLSGKGQESQ